MTMMAATASLFVVSLALGANFADAQGQRLPVPVRVEKVASVKLAETREVFVSLPDDYDGSARKYPVIYMMDGEINFTSGVIGGVRQAAMLGLIPEFIIVGIKNTDRSRDVFPEVITYPDGDRAGGRANQYLDFIREELIPFVSRVYRTDDYRILYGTSNSGFTAVHALFRTPDLANGYIAASATLSVPVFQSQKDKLIRGFRGGTRGLVLVMGEHDLPTVVSLNGALKETIADLAPPGLSCRLTVLEGAEHVPADALVQGLRVLFHARSTAGGDPKGGVR